MTGLGGWLCLALVVAPAQPPAPVSPPQADSWKLETVVRTPPFEPLEGLVVRQDPAGIELRQVIRKPGRPTFIITVRVPQDQVERVDLLDSEDRDLLVKRLDLIVAERAKRFARLKLLEKPPAPGSDSAEPTVGLSRADWPTDKPGTQRAWKYAGQRFTLITTARPEIAELCALQLDQVFSAFERLLPARQESGPVSILVTSSLEEWQALCKARGRAVLNPAWCDTSIGEVGLATDQTKLDARMEQLRVQHTQNLSELQSRGDELRKAYGGKLPPELQRPFDQSLKSLRETAITNERILRQERDRLFSRMNHEVFHAYLSRFVLRPGMTIPPWLNEGLAQLFESALVEAGDLRADLADPERVKRFRAEVQAGRDLALEELLKSPASRFHVTGSDDMEASRQAYLASWALCSWLVLDKGRLRLEDLDGFSSADPALLDSRAIFGKVFSIPVEEAQNQVRETFRKGAPGQSRAVPPATSGETATRP